MYDDDGFLFGISFGLIAWIAGGAALAIILAIVTAALLSRFLRTAQGKAAYAGFKGGRIATRLRSILRWLRRRS